MSIEKILCIGAGYVGGPTMAVIAEHCPEIRVEVADSNLERIAAWSSDKLPVYENGLAEIINNVRGKNLFFITDVERAIDEADMIFVSVNTPTKTFGEGAGFASDLQYCEAVARLIAQTAKSPKIIVEKSTLPVRCAESIQRVLECNSLQIKFEVISNPEFLSEGSAIHDLESPDRILIGSSDTPAGQLAAEKLADIYRHWVPEEKIKFTNVWSSELSKLAANAFLAQRVSSINSLCGLCEATGANITEVASIVGSDSRIGDKFLAAGIGFGGSCFRKDLLNLIYLCRRYNLPVEAEYWESVLKINASQQKSMLARISRALFDSLANKKIAVLGAAFKANTGDVRESPAINIIKFLLDEKAEVYLYDPQAMDNAQKAVENHTLGSFVLADNPYSASEGADAIVLLTDWAIFQELDYKRIYQNMKKPAFVFDGRNVLDHDKLYDIGFDVHPIGISARSHTA